MRKLSPVSVITGLLILVTASFACQEEAETERDQQYDLLDGRSNTKEYFYDADAKVCIVVFNRVTPKPVAYVVPCENVKGKLSEVGRALYEADLTNKATP